MSNSNSNYTTSNVSNNFPSLTEALSNARTSISSGFVSDSNSASGSSSSSSTAFFSWNSWKLWAIIFLVLAFLGINIFFYIAKGSQYITDTFGYLIGLIGATTINTTKKTIDLTNSGVKTGADVVSNTINTSINTVQNTASDVKGAITKNTTIQNAGSSNYNSNDSNNNNNNTNGHDYKLDTALNNASSNIPEKTSWSHPTYTSDDSYSAIQANKSSSKSGWCYIGEDRGIRSCLQVGENDTCLSGDIFPTSDICINPNLRR